MVFRSAAPGVQSTGSMAAYAATMAVAVPLWWVALHVIPAVRVWFVPDAEWPAFQWVVVPDGALAIVTGLLAVRLWQHRASGLLVGLVCGAWGYATFWAGAWALSVGAPIYGPLAMIGAAGGFGAMARDVAETGTRRVD